MPSASARGIHRASPTASGSASSSSAPVAPAESRKPYDAASHGSAMSSTVTASESTATPAPRRPVSRATSAIVDIAPARITLASGVTSTTKPASAARETTTRVRRPAPHAAQIPKAIAATSEQLLPDTAVRCDSDDAFISASSSSVTPLVSPTESPGSSPAPGSGRSCVTNETKPRRRSLAIANTCCGGARISSASANTTATDASPASDGSPPPETATRAPRSRACGGSSMRSSTRTGADAPSTDADPSNRTPPADGSTLVRTCTTRSDTRPSSSAATAARAGWARATWAATIPAAAHATARRGNKGAADRNRCRSAAVTCSDPADEAAPPDRCVAREARKGAAPSAAIASAQSAPAIHGAQAGRSTEAIAAPHAATATGSMRRSRPVTPSPGRAATRAPWGRCPKRRADRRPWRRAPRCRASR